MDIARIELNRTGRGFHVQGKPGSSPAGLLDATIRLLRDYVTPVDTEEAGHDYHLQLDEGQVDIVRERGEGRIPGQLYDTSKLGCVDMGEHSRITGTRPIADITLRLKASARADYGSLRDAADYAARCATIVTPIVFGSVQGYTDQGWEDPRRTRNLQREIVWYGQQRLALG